jgi:hypothetical protein
MTDFLTEIPRWVTNLAFWVALIAMLACTWGVHRSFKGSRAEINRALDDLYEALDRLTETQHPTASPLSAPLTAPDNVRDIPTTKTAVARTDEAVEGLKATLGLPTDPDKLPTQPAAPTEEIRIDLPDHPGDPARITDTPAPDAWSYVLNPNHQLEHIDGHTIPAFRDPHDTPTPDQLQNPTHPDLQAVPGQHLNGATRLDLSPIGGRHRHPEDDE